MQQLNFPSFHFRLKNSENKTVIFDEIRKKFVVLTPEEWVRQHVVHYLLHIKKYPQSLINAEKKIQINDRIKRYDVVVFNPDGTIFLLVECKAVTIPIDQQTFDQIARYNMTLKAHYLMITNGMNHYFCTMDYQTKTYNFIPELPNYNL